MWPNLCTLTLLLPHEFCAISRLRLHKAYFSLPLLLSPSLVLLILIGHAAPPLANLLQVIAFSLVLPLFLGNPRSKTQFLVLLPKRSTRHWQVWLVKFNGYIICWLIFIFLLNTLRQYTVTINLPSILLTTPPFMNAPNTSR